MATGPFDNAQDAVLTDFARALIGQRLPLLTFRASCDMMLKVFLLLTTKSFIPHCL
jgi:hypothetical protein